MNAIEDTMRQRAHEYEDMEALLNPALDRARRILAENDRPHGENPYLPQAPADGQHQWSEGPTDLGGNRRCTFCGAYKGSVEAEGTCKGQFAESGKMRAWAADTWKQDLAEKEKDK